MRKSNVFLIGCFLLLSLSVKGQEDTIIQRIILIGDAGELTLGKHPVVDAVRDNIKLDQKTTIIYLGDNLYKVGLPNDQSANYATSRAILDSQLSIARNTPAKVYMIPGNHDWESGGRGGLDAIIRQQLYVDFLRIPNVKYFPEDGCPGPIEVSLGNDITMIIFDSQWWLHPHDKPGIESDCPYKTKEELATQIGDIAARNSKKLIILASHHPFKTNGTHGNAYTLKQHIFPFTDIKKNLYIPLPVIGSIYPLARGVFGSPQDLKHPVYANMVGDISEVLKDIPNVVFISGHDHNLQHIVDSNHNYIVSGSGGYKQNRTVKHPSSLFNSKDAGFGVMEISKNKNVTLTFYSVIDSFHKVYGASLLNFSTIPEAAIDSSIKVEIVDPFAKYKDTITVPASNKYPLVKGLKKFFMGQNYRPEWSTPVNMKVFNLQKEKGGFEVISFAGGKETKSLRLRNKKTGKEWVLSSINKNSTRAIPENLRGNIAQNLINELNSSTHPYAAFAIPGLARALDLSTPSPELFFVPKDPAFGFYEPLFAENICILEPQDISADGAETKTTAKLLNKMLEDNDHRPDSQLVLRARLLDIVIGDFDRHFDQWKWGTVDSTKGKSIKGRIYHPIPKNRGQALFNSDGFIIKVASGRAMPFLKGFRYQIPKVEWLGYRAKDFDRIYLTDLDSYDWKRIITDVQQKLTDSVITNSVKQMPPEAFAIRGEETIKKMISRRDLIAKDGMKYYRFLSKTVNVIGSNEKEYFKVNNLGSGLQVRVYGRSREKDTTFIIFDRVFFPSETKEIRLFGLNDDDKFVIDSNTTSRIKIRIIGGKGNDTFDLKGSVESLLYDLKSEGNLISNNRKAKNRFSAAVPVNDQNILGFNYNTTKLPQLNFNYNADDGFIIRGGISIRTYGFRNLPYASDHRFSVLYAPYRNAYQFRYAGELNHITRNIDLVLKGHYANPALRNFFGLGNNADVDDSKKFSFYQTRYKTFEFEALVRKRLFERLELMAGPWFNLYKSNYKDNVDNISGQRDNSGLLDSARVFTKKSYLGAKLAVRFDNRNNELFPTRGLLWNSELLLADGITGNSYKYMKFHYDMALYASFKEPANLVLALKMGGGRIFNKNFEYFQAMSFGLENNLYGFRKNRYAGRSMFYAGLDLKAKLFSLNSYILPGDIGLIGFYNIGRVGIKEEKSRTYHGAFGGGFYFLPYKLFLISATLGFSDGEKLPNFTIGTKVNFAY